MTDPFYLDKSYYDAHPEAPAGEKKVYGSEGFSPEDITGADYIILNHVHGGSLQPGGDAGCAQ